MLDSWTSYNNIINLYNFISSLYFTVENFLWNCIFLLLALWEYCLYPTIWVFHSLQGDMVDCNPAETLSIEAEPRLTIITGGGVGCRCAMLSREEYHSFFIVPNVAIAYTTSILCYKIILLTGWHFNKWQSLLWRCYDIGFSIRIVRV